MNVDAFTDTVKGGACIVPSFPVIEVSQVSPHRNVLLLPPNTSLPQRCETKVSAMSDSVDTPVKENEEQQVGDFDYGECIVLELTISL